MTVNAVATPDGGHWLMTDFRPVPDGVLEPRRVRVLPTGDDVIVVVDVERMSATGLTKDYIGARMTREDWRLITDMISEVHA